MITATITRTDAKQVAELGAVAWSDMRFDEAHTSVEAVSAYCERLAQRDGIINPEIIVTLCCIRIV